MHPLQRCFPVFFLFPCIRMDRLIHSIKEKGIFRVGLFRGGGSYSNGKGTLLFG
jgi:hypothetical protein